MNKNKKLSVRCTIDRGNIRYNMAEVFLTQPLQIVVGSEAGSKWMSDDLFKRAASKDKHLHVMQGSNHMKMYDVPKYVDDAASVLGPFFERVLEPAKLAKVKAA